MHLPVCKMLVTVIVCGFLPHDFQCIARKPSDMTHHQPMLVSISDNRRQEQSAQINHEMKQVLNLWIDSIFKEGDVIRAFEQCFYFSPLSKEEKLALKDMGFNLLEPIQKYNDKKLNARVLAVAWQSEYLSVHLALGTKLLAEDRMLGESISLAQKTIDKELQRILRHRGLTNDEYFSLLDISSAKNLPELTQKLDAIEQIFSEVTRFTQKNINSSILTKNLSEMKQNFKFGRKASSKSSIYEVGVDPTFVIVLSQHDKGFKIIALSDGY